MKSIAFILTLLIIAQPISASAQARPGGGGSRPSGGARPGGGARPNAPAQRPAPGGGGFDFNRDVNASRPPQNRPNPPSTAGRPNPPARPNPPQNRPNNPPQNRPNPPQNRPNVPPQNRPNVPPQNRPVNPPPRPPNYTVINRNQMHTTVVNNRTYVVNPIYRGPAWGWHGGVVWSPYPSYWGGGFWGGFAVGAATAVVFGSLVYNSRTYTSYQIQPSSPGAQLLSNYQLTQTPCGPPNLVVIFGPNNGVICAYPNNLVAPGNYNVDSSNLSLVSQ